MASSIVSTIVISGIEEGYTAEYIANTLWKQGLAQVKCITMLPYIEHYTNTIHYTAYTDIQEWSDTEAAFNFIKRLTRTNTARIVHHDDLHWHASFTPDYNANRNELLQHLATHFNTSYFHKFHFSQEDEYEDEELEDEYEELEDEYEELEDEYEELEDEDEYEELGLDLTLYDLRPDLELEDLSVIESVQDEEHEFNLLFHNLQDPDENEPDNEDYHHLQLIQEEQLQYAQEQEQHENDDSWDTLVRDSHMMRLHAQEQERQQRDQTDQRLQPSNGYDYDHQPDYNYIQSILDRIDNNHISTMEQGYLYSQF